MLSEGIVGVWLIIWHVIGAVLPCLIHVVISVLVIDQQIDGGIFGVIRMTVLGLETSVLKINVHTQSERRLTKMTWLWIFFLTIATSSFPFGAI